MASMHPFEVRYKLQISWLEKIHLLVELRGGEKVTAFPPS